jgi:hypothetical protein
METPPMTGPGAVTKDAGLRTRIWGGDTMAHTIRRVNYFYTTVRDEPGEAYQLLSRLAELGINLYAFTAVPVGPLTTQLTLFPQDTAKMTDVAQKAGLALDGPYNALLVQGDDELGALAGVHEKLYRASVNVYAANAVANGTGGYGYVIYVRPEEFDRAAAALDV